jgi:hypothetical protein
MISSFASYRKQWITKNVELEAHASHESRLPRPVVDAKPP